MNRFLLPTLVAAAIVQPAAAADPMAEACERLQQSMEQVVEALEQIQQREDVEEVLPELRAALDEQKSLLSVNEEDLWQYIDNTEGVKQPLVDVLSRLALELSRMESAAFFQHEELKSLLLPQTEESEASQHAKIEKARGVHDDED